MVDWVFKLVRGLPTEQLSDCMTKLIQTAHETGTEGRISLWTFSCSGRRQEMCAMARGNALNALPSLDVLETASAMVPMIPR